MPMFTSKKESNGGRKMSSGGDEATRRLGGEDSNVASVDIHDNSSGGYISTDSGPDVATDLLDGGVKIPNDVATDVATDILTENITNNLGTGHNHPSPATQVFFGDTKPENKIKTELSAHQDPVVGWLVVIDGPGRGEFHPLGHGMNTIGRGRINKVSLDYGDQEISRENHAVLTYDPKSKQFYVQHGGGRNLTYLDNAPLLTPVMVNTGQDIHMGSTVVRFVAFCGPDFDWN